MVIYLNKYLSKSNKYDICKKNFDWDYLLGIKFI